MQSKEKLIQNLIYDGYLKTPSIIEAFKNIDRADFVPKNFKNIAYENKPLPIDFDQTISQPLTVAFMLELLEPKPGEKILDIGSGSGWQATLLAYIVGNKGKVITIERIPELKSLAEKNISKYNFIENKIVQIFQGDGVLGYEQEAPYDKIIAAASSKTLPVSWKNQLKIGGKIIAPIGESIYVFKKESQNKFIEEQYFGFTFVPLMSDI